jgi:N-acetylmuramoyl-L-alanine amidase
MPDDDRFYGDDDGQPEDEINPPPAGDEDIPASVAFMEMMRQAAAKAAKNAPPPPLSWTDPAIPRKPLIKPKGSPAPVASGEANSAPDTAAVSATADATPAAPSELDAALEEQRIRRVKRRKTRRRRRTVGVLGGIVRSVIVVFAAAGLMATIFTWWTPSGFISSDVRQELSVAIATSAVTQEPTALPTPNWLRRVGIVSGHRGPQNDPGAVCPDGLTEASITFNVSQMVVRSLRSRGYTVDLLDEFDPRLDNYQAAALVSIHANTCQVWDGEIVSGYLIAAAASRVSARGNDEVLVDCISRNYAVASGLEKREGVTQDMTDYHSFREIHPFTPAAIIELGFMLADRDELTNKPDALARGISDGILCFLEPGTNQPPTLTPDS